MSFLTCPFLHKTMFGLVVADIYSKAMIVHSISRLIPVILSKDETKVKSRAMWESKYDTLVGFSLVEKLSFMTILCHFGCVIPNTSHQLGHIIPKTIFLLHWTFLVILDSVTKDHVFY